MPHFISFVGCNSLTPSGCRSSSPDLVVLEPLRGAALQENLHRHKKHKAWYSICLLYIYITSALAFLFVAWPSLPLER